MLLDNGLTEHLLVELCSRWNSDLEDLVENKNKNDEMRDGVTMLKKKKNIKCFE